MFLAPPAHSHVNILRELAVGVVEEYGSLYRITFGTTGSFLEMGRSVGLEVFDISIDDPDCQKMDGPFHNELTSMLLHEDPLKRFSVLGKLMVHLYECHHDVLETKFQNDRPDLLILDFFETPAIDLANKYNIDWIPTATLGIGGFETPIWHPNSLFGYPLQNMHSFSARVKNFYHLMKMIPTFMELDRITRIPRVSRGYNPKSNFADEWSKRLVIIPEPWMFHPSRPVTPNAQLIGFLSPPQDSPRAAALTNPEKDKELFVWLNSLPSNSKVIYFAFGSHVIPPLEVYGKILNGILAALHDDSFILLACKHYNTSTILSSIKQVSQFPNIESRLKVMAWVPQRAILSHRSIHFFVSHGGLSSIAESVDSGVPLLIIPFFGDQPRNAFLIQDAEVGVAVRSADLNAELISQQTSYLLANYDKFKKNAQKLKAVSDLCGGRKRAAQLIHTHIQYGSDYLIDAGHGFSFVERYCLDILFVVLVMIGIFLYLMVKILFFVKRLIQGKRKVQ
jgi:hypothetical protein